MVFWVLLLLYLLLYLFVVREGLSYFQRSDSDVKECKEVWKAVPSHIERRAKEGFLCLVWKWEILPFKPLFPKIQ